MENTQTYKIGTRGSLLALTQCLQLKTQMEEMGLGRFELEIIQTQGDEDTSKPLWQLDGKDFFTKELDTALLNKQVDLVVHSYKDLGSERPDGIKLAAVTKRKYPHDILFIKKTVIQQLKNNELNKLVVGTSSPRRMTNITAHLKHYLPFGENLKVETISLRGNVNTRLQKCAGPDYDAIVLALPGIERLATGLSNQDNPAYQRHGDPRTILTNLLTSLDFMILPTSQFPAAASQGALGVECLENNQELLKKLARLECAETKKEVRKEREVFASFGGGCHLAVGITARNVANQTRLNVLGVADDKHVEKNELITMEGLPALPEFSTPLQKKEIFIGISPASAKQANGYCYDQLLVKKPIGAPLKLTAGLTDILYASGRAFEFGHELAQSNPQAKVWASGTRTWKKMAKAGYWCHGCADALGEGEVKSLRESDLLTLMTGKPQWSVVTNDTSENILGSAIGVYTTQPREESLDLDKDKGKGKEKETNKEFKQQIEKVKIFFWSSFNQYLFYNKTYNLSQTAHHLCGLGKTYTKFQENNITVRPISGMKEFIKWSEEII